MVGYGHIDYQKTLRVRSTRTTLVEIDAFQNIQAILPTVMRLAARSSRISFLT